MAIGSSTNIPEAAEGGTIVYIDGLNFYNAVRGTSNKWVDFGQIGRRLTPSSDILGGTKYFTAQISGKAAEDPQSPQRHRLLIRAAQATENVEVIEGKFQVPDAWRSLSKYQWPGLFRPEIPEEIIANNADHFATHQERPWKVRVQLPQEKFTDVAIGVHLVRDLNQGLASKAIVVTNDADLTPAIQLSVADGFEVGVISPDRVVSRDLAGAASWSRPMRADLPEQCQLPQMVIASNGRQINKPRAWSKT